MVELSHFGLIPREHRIVRDKEAIIRFIHTHETGRKTSLTLTGHTREPGREPWNLIFPWGLTTVQLWR